MAANRSTLRVLVADDSVVIRSALKNALSGLAGVGEVSTASSGKFALEKLRQTPIDLLITDLNISQLDGIEILKAIKEEKIATRCVMFAAKNNDNSKRGATATSLGAIDILEKPVVDSVNDERVVELINTALGPRIRQLLNDLSSAENTTTDVSDFFADNRDYARVDFRMFKPNVLVIASSTGGPDALEKALVKIRPGISVPILIAQHMPPFFTASLAKRLGDLTGLPSAEAKSGEPVLAGRIYVAPGDFHMSVVLRNGAPTICIDQSPPILYVRPAANKLMISVAELYPGKALGLVLTGMGEDGTLGAIALKESGSAVIIQDQASSVVWGMPGSVYKAGAFDQIADLPTIAEIVADRCS
jgi:two-component system chemotaxis response regulator CheB